MGKMRKGGLYILRTKDEHRIAFADSVDDFYTTIDDHGKWIPDRKNIWLAFHDSMVYNDPNEAMNIAQQMLKLLRSVYLTEFEDGVLLMKTFQDSSFKELTHYEKDDQKDF